MQLPLLFGRFLENAGLATDEQVGKAYELQRELSPNLGVIAVLENLLSVDALRQVFAYQRRTGRLFRQAALDLNLLDEAGLAHLETCAPNHYIMIGEALLAQGVLTAAALDNALRAFDEFIASLPKTTLPTGD